MVASIIFLSKKKELIMKKLLAAGLIALTSATAARAGSMTVYDAYMGMDFGLGMMSYIDTTADELKNFPTGALLLGFDFGMKFRPLDSIYNPGFSISWNSSFPTEPEEWPTKQKPSFSWYTFGADFDNYFAIANREDESSRTDLILGIGYHAFTESWVGGGLGSDSATDMSLAIKLGLDQSISEDMKFNIKLQFFGLPGTHKYEKDVFTKLSIGFKMMF